MPQSVRQLPGPHLTPTARDPKPSRMQIRSILQRPPIAAAAFLLVVGVMASACSKPAEITIGSVGELMAYDIPTFTVKAGQKVHLTLKNDAAMPTMSHNWVLVKPGTEAAVSSAAQTAGEAKGFIPLVGDVLASTEQAKPGQRVEITFTAPAAGTYPYICTNPGHYMTMKGTMVVTE